MYRLTVSEWKHTKPKEYFRTALRLFGEPTAYDNVPDGFALWKIEQPDDVSKITKETLFDEHILRDEYVEHCVPSPHYDFFYSSIRFHVPAQRVWNVLQLTGSLNYDGLKKTLTARCGGIGANYATLYLAMKIGAGELRIQDVKSYDLYPKMIRNELITREKMRKEMVRLKKENHSMYEVELSQPFAGYAFSGCPAQSGGQQTVHIASQLRNTRDEPCTTKNMTGCCPHMRPDSKGRYRATNEKTRLRYRGNRYELYTCCLMCSDAMVRLAEEDPEQFKDIYIVKTLPSGDLVLRNRVTKEPVQVVRRV